MTEGIWVRAAALSDLDGDDPVGLELEGKAIALYRVGDAYFATANICTHAFALLSDGFLEGCVIECPLHNGRFDVRTGKALASPVEKDLETFPLEVRDGEIFLELSGRG